MCVLGRCPCEIFVNPFIPWSNFSEKPLGLECKTFTAREHDRFGKVVLTSELVDEKLMLWSDNLNETSLVVL